MSRIPVARRGDSGVSRFPKPTERSNIPVTFGIKRATAGNPSEVFKSTPTMQELEARSLPDEISGQPRIFGRPEQIDALYLYVRATADRLFAPVFFKSMFPSALVSMKNATLAILAKRKSRIPTSRRSSIASDLGAETDTPGEMDISDPLKVLKRLGKTRRPQILAISDFCILYSALILVVSPHDEPKMMCLNFLIFLFGLDVTPRDCDLRIIFAVLVRQTEPPLRGDATEILAMLCDMSDDIHARVETGARHHDPGLSGLCMDALQLSTMEVTGGLVPPEFADVPSEATPAVVAEMFHSYVEALAGGGLPPDPVAFSRNVVDTIARFDRVPVVLERGAETLRAVLPLCGLPPPELVARVIGLCFSILSGDSFLDGDASFEAIEAIQSLAYSLFETFPPNVLLPAIAGAVSTMQESHLPLLITQLRDYLKAVEEIVTQDQINDIAIALDTFHPTLSCRPDFLRSRRAESNTEAYDVMADSIRRLMNPDTVLDEVDVIVTQRDSAVIQHYPGYLRGFLQRAFVLYTGTDPAGITADERAGVLQSIANCRALSAEDFLTGGRCSIESLTERFHRLKRK